MIEITEELAADITEVVGLAHETLLDDVPDINMDTIEDVLEDLQNSGILSDRIEKSLTKFAEELDKIQELLDAVGSADYKELKAKLKEIEDKLTWAPLGVHK